MSQTGASSDVFTDATFGWLDAVCFFNALYDVDGLVRNLNEVLEELFRRDKALPIVGQLLLPNGGRLMVVAERALTSFERAWLIAHLERGQDVISPSGRRVIGIPCAVNLAKPLASGYMRVQALEFDRAANSDFHPAHLLRACKAVQVAHPGCEPRLTHFGRFRIQRGYMACRELGTRDLDAMNALHGSTNQFIHPVVGIDGLFDVPDANSPHCPVR